MKEIIIKLPTHEKMAREILSDGIGKVSENNIIAVIGWLERELEKRHAYDVNKKM